MLATLHILNTKCIIRYCGRPCDKSIIIDNIVLLDLSIFLLVPTVSLFSSAFPLFASSWLHARTSHFRYINHYKLGDYSDLIYLIEFVYNLMKVYSRNVSYVLNLISMFAARCAWYFDLHLDIDRNDRLRRKFYDNRDALNFPFH